MMNVFVSVSRPLTLTLYPKGERESRADWLYRRGHRVGLRKFQPRSIKLGCHREDSLLDKPETQI
jgi:hypothetical protein